MAVSRLWGEGDLEYAVQTGRSIHPHKTGVGCVSSEL